MKTQKKIFNHVKNLKTELNTERPYSSFNMKMKARRLLHDQREKDFRPLTEANLISEQRKRPMTSLESIAKKIPPKLDVLNLIIETSPNKFNLDKISEKIKQLNTVYRPISECSTTSTNVNFPSFLNNEKTAEIYYKYNLLYGSNTNNLIRTYSPKMRPMSASIGEYVKSLKIDSKVEYVFDQDEIYQLINAKCTDLGIEFRENMVSKFTDYCNSKCKNRKVDLSECYLGLTSINILSNILITEPNKISQLNLAHNQIGDKGIIILCNSISNSRALVCLNVMSNSISHKGGEHFINMLIDHKSLVNINISSSEGINRNRLSCQGLKNIEEVFTNNKILEYFNVAGNSIKSEGLELIIKGLNKNYTLNSLNISNNDLDKNALCNGFEKLKTARIIELNISNNPIYKEGLGYLVQHLRNFPNLKKLDISHCHLEFFSVYELFIQLETLKRIDTLNLTNNDISNKRFFQLKEVFPHINLKNLYMSNCNIGNKCGYIMGECLSANETIRKIDLSDNKIDDSGFASFIPLVEKTKSLKFMNLSRNFIGDLTAIDFFSNLKYNHTIRNINFYDNQLRNDSGTKLIEILDSNKTLRNVNLGFNRVQMKIIEEVNKRLKQNALTEKAKRVPNLERKIIDLTIRPDARKNIIKETNEISETNKELESKLVEDIAIYPKKKLELKTKLDAMEEENNEINDRNTNLFNTAVQLNNEINQNNNEYDNEVEKINNEMNIIKKEMEKTKKEKENNLDIMDKNKREYEYSLNKVKESHTISMQALDLAKKRIEKLQNDLENKKNILEKLLNPPPPIASPTSQSPIKQTKTLKNKGKKGGKNTDDRGNEKNNNNEINKTATKNSEILEDEKEESKSKGSSPKRKKGKKNKKNKLDNIAVTEIITENDNNISGSENGQNNIAVTLPGIANADTENKKFIKTEPNLDEKKKKDTDIKKKKSTVTSKKKSSKKK